MGQERSESDLKRDAAQRLLKLRRKDESPAEFARRLGVTSQHIHNYKTAGLSLGVLARMADRIGRDDLVFVITGKRGTAGEEVMHAKAEAFDRITAAIVREVEGLPALKSDAARKKAEGLSRHLRHASEDRQAAKKEPKGRTGRDRENPGDPPKQRRAGGRGQ